MTRAQLKLKAKSQINNQILVLAICHFIVYIVSNASLFLDYTARAIYYPTQFAGFWFRTSMAPAIRYLIPSIMETIKNSNIDPQYYIYFKNTMDPMIVHSVYPVHIMAAVSILAIISFLVVPAFSLGICRMYLSLTKGEKISVSKFLNNITSFGKALWLQILITIFTFLWTLLLIIPGIIKSLSYSMAFYILAENPNMTAREALNESKHLMDGHKMDYFILQISFIWWYILAGLTLGIAYIYVCPYISATDANFYREIRKSDENDVAYTAPEVQNNYEDGFEEQE